MSTSVISSQFFQLLQTLKEEELKEFKKTLKSDEALKVYQHIVKFKAIALKKKKLEKKEVFEAVFKKDYDSKGQKTINYKLSELKIKLEDFLVQQELNNQAFTKKYLLLTNLGRRNAITSFNKKMEEARNMLENDKTISNWKPLNKFKINQLDYYGIEIEKQLTSNLSIQNAMHYLDTFYFETKLKISCEILSREKLIREKKDIFLLEELIKAAKENSFSESAFLGLYILAYELIIYERPKTYYLLKKLIEEKSLLLKKEDKYILWSYLLNFAIQNINKGQDIFIQEAFQLYNYAIENGLLMFNGLLTSIRFLNIIEIACNVQQAEWARKFLKTNECYLEINDKEDVTLLGEARILFEERKFSEVIDNINLGHFNSTIYDIRARILALRAFYEIDKENTPFLLSTTKAIYTFLKRKEELNNTITKGPFIFLKYFKKLVKKKTTKKILLEEFEPLSFNFYKKWFIEKISELKD